MAPLNFGEVIYVERDCGIFGYKHFGIYSDYGAVIHYVKSDSDEPFDGVICETSLEEFIKHDNCYLCSFDCLGRQIDGKASHEPTSILGCLKAIYDLTLGEQPTIYSPAETVARARSRLGQRGYNLLLNNCEHFAIWCKTGLEKSEQVDSFLDGVFKVAEEMFIRSKFR